MNDIICPHGKAKDCTKPRCIFAYADIVKNFDRMRDLCQRLYLFAEHTKEVMADCYRWVNYSAGVDWDAIGYQEHPATKERFDKLHRDVNDFEHFDEDLFYDI